MTKLIGLCLGIRKLNIGKYFKPTNTVAFIFYCCFPKLKALAQRYKIGRFGRNIGIFSGYFGISEAVTALKKLHIPLNRLPHRGKIITAFTVLYIDISSGAIYGYPLKSVSCHSFV